MQPGSMQWQQQALVTQNLTPSLQLHSTLRWNRWLQVIRSRCSTSFNSCSWSRLILPPVYPYIKPPCHPNLHCPHWPSYSYVHFHQNPNLVIQLVDECMIHALRSYCTSPPSLIHSNNKRGGSLAFLLTHCIQSI